MHKSLYAREDIYKLISCLVLVVHFSVFIVANAGSHWILLKTLRHRADIRISTLMIKILFQGVRLLVQSVERNINKSLILSSYSL